MDNQNAELVAIEHEDGSITFEPEGGFADDQPPVGFGENLVPMLEESTLRFLGSELVDGVRADDQSRQEWRRRAVKGMRMLGLLDGPMAKLDDQGESAAEGDDDGLEKLKKWLSKSHSTLLAEGVVQSQARMMAELMPPAGPAKVVVPGDANQEARDQADRVSEYLNYQYTIEMPEAMEEMDRLFFWLPLWGSCFTKTYFDDAKERPTVRYIQPDDLIVPYHTTDLESASRITHVSTYPRHRMAELMEMGYFVDSKIEFANAEAGDDGDSTLSQAMEIVEGKRGTSSKFMDEIYKVYEIHARIGIPELDELEDEKDIFGGSRPYIIHVEPSTQTILRITRNWSEDDPREEPLQYFSHFPYFPGPGFYGLGLMHLMGGNQETATGIQRALLDSAHRANSPAFFATRDLNLGDQSFTPGPGEVVQTEVSAQELKDGLLPLPFNEPSRGLMELLGIVTESTRRFMSITEEMVGAGDGNTAVGTTLARIEQGTRIFAGTHKRSHRALTHQLRILQRINADYMYDPDHQGYPYDVMGEEKRVYQADFSGLVRLVPVSDPNIFSESQRAARYQALIDLASRFPDQFNNRKLAEAGLKVVGYDDPDEFLIESGQMPYLDPISENDAIMRGLPVKAHYEQDHKAHMLAHQFFFDSLPDEFKQQHYGAYLAHMSEHLSLNARVELSTQLGQPLPPPDLDAEGWGQNPGIDPEIEQQIAAVAAQAAQAAMMEQQAMAAQTEQPAPPPEATGGPVPQS